MKVAVFIDNSNVFKSIKKFQKSDRSWESFYNPYELAKRLAGNRELSYIGFYCVHPPAYLLDEDKKHKAKYILTERYYSEIEKLPLTEVKYGDLNGPKGQCQEKNVDTQIATDIVAQSALSKFDVAILVSNDGDFVSAVENAKIFGKKVEVVFFKGYLSMNLRRCCDITRRARKAYFQPLSFNRRIEKTSTTKEEA